MKALRTAGLHLDDDLTRSALEGIGETWEYKNWGGILPWEAMPYQLLTNFANVLE